MKHWIEEIGETRRLILAWQAPDEYADRVRWAVGELAQSQEGPQFRYFDGEEFQWLNDGREHEKLRTAGYLGYPAFDRGASQDGVFRYEVLDAFMRRLPPSSRPDFGRYLEHFRLRSETKLNAFSLLGITEARLPSDGFSLIDPLDADALSRDIVFEIAGHRHNVRNRENLVAGQQLRLGAEPTNSHDPNAIRIEAGGELIGHVNRLQAPTFGKWLRQRAVSGWLLRLNGTPEKPRAFAFVKVRPLASRRAA